MLKVYGIKASRAARTHWLCRELGLPFEAVQVSFADANSKTPEFLNANPSGKIPTIDDAGFQLSESMAINIYLAKKHQSPLMPRDLQGEAKVLQWSFWVMTEIEKPLLNLLLLRMPPPSDPTVANYFRERIGGDPNVEKTSVDALQKPLAYLDAHLANRDYLLGREFTLADLNVACVMMWALRAKLDLTEFPNVQRWLTVCTSRPAARG